MASNKHLCRGGVRKYLDCGPCIAVDYLETKVRGLEEQFARRRPDSELYAKHDQCGGTGYGGTGYLVVEEDEDNCVCEHGFIRLDILAAQESRK